MITLSEMNAAVKAAYEAQEAFYKIVGEINIERRTQLHNLDGGMYEGLISLANPLNRVPGHVYSNSVRHDAKLLQLMSEAFK